MEETKKYWLKVLETYCQKRYCPNYELSNEILSKFPDDTETRIYFEKGSTIRLREICKRIGYDYWAKDGLKNLNAINTIDTISLYIHTNSVHTID